MKPKIPTLLAALMFVAVPVIGGIGCSREVAHSESDKPGWFGGSTHEEKTTYKNADGTYSTESEKKHVDN